METIKPLVSFTAYPGNVRQDFRAGGEYEVPEEDAALYRRKNLIERKPGSWSRKSRKRLD